MRLIINDSLPIKGASHMEVRELKDALAAFNPAGEVSVAIPATGEPHQVRMIHLIGHLDHPGEVKDQRDHPGALDIVCDCWDVPRSPKDGASSPRISDLIAMIAPYPDTMHVRVAVPVVHDSISHRMLDIVMLGHAVGTPSGIQIVCESWDNLHQVIREFPEAVAKRLAGATSAAEGV